MRRTCGQIFWFSAHGGRLLRGGNVFVALKMVKVALSMEMMMSAHEKLIPRRKNLATLTRALIFCKACQSWAIIVYHMPTYDVSRLLLVCEPFLLLQSVFFFEGRTEHVAHVSRGRPRCLHGAFQWSLHRWVVVVVGIRHLNRLVLVIVDVAEANVRNLWLGHEVVGSWFDGRVHCGRLGEACGSRRFQRWRLE